ncbi:hypothetical protein K503DRAFT_863950 [Rhizopogon vinicolor AM-OR11-026]|uniref:TEA domain-containing protein n=1 Tax=Rhizopogon vinicolor AM-OR11-026 TaxID=1314800 RepID=A0A1B7N8Z0_9AGAM|nr:hypothetical protein K503DRAFT_863950 [Rhizopogon vinicolor AM-OR11-026]
MRYLKPGTQPEQAIEAITEKVQPMLFIPIPPEVSLPTAVHIKKSKPSHTRYEDIWSEDVHAAFMEAIDIYPPMGKLRLRHEPMSRDNGEDANAGSSRRVKWLGRCQLIQSYIQEKTGQIRTRKQVSSHLQRMKKLSKKRPTKHVLFHETSWLTQEPPNQDPKSPASSREGTQSPGTVPSMPSPSGQVLLSNDILPIVRRAFEGQTSDTAAVYGSTLYVNNMRRSSSGERQEVSNFMTVSRAISLLPTGTTVEGESTSTGSEFTSSLRRLGNKLHSLNLESERPANVYSSSQVHWSPGCQVPHGVARDDSSFMMDYSCSYPMRPAVHVDRDCSSFTMMDSPCNYPSTPQVDHVARDYPGFTTMHSPCNYPLTPTDQIFHNPLQPPQIMRFEKRRVVPENFDGSCHWLFSANTSGSVLDSDSYASHTYTTGIGLPSVLESSLPFSDTQNSPFYMNYNDPHLEHEGQYHARRASLSTAYDPCAPYAHDLSALGLPRAQLADPRYFHHPCGHDEEQLTSPLLVKPIASYPAAYTHTDGPAL